MSEIGSKNMTEEQSLPEGELPEPPHGQSQEAQDERSPAPGRPSSLAVWMSGSLLVIAAISAYSYSQVRDLQDRVKGLSDARRVEASRKNEEIDRLTREQARLSAQLKQAFDDRKNLLKERDSLSAKVKGIGQGVGPDGKPLISGSLPTFPPEGHVEPVTIRPLVPGTGGEAPALRDGGKLLVQRAEGYCVLEPLPAPYQAALGKGIKVSGLPAALHRLPPPPVGLFALASPVGIVSESARPVFSWKPAGSGARHQVIVLDSQDKEAARSPWLEGDSWSPEAALPRGAVYRWKMMVMLPGEKEPKPRAEADGASFAVAGQEEVDRLEKVRHDSPRSSLLLAIASAEAGLIDDAEAALARLKKANPQSPLPDLLLRQIRRAAGL